MPEGIALDTRDPNLVANTVKVWLGNPVSRGLLKFACGKTNNGDNRLELALRKCAGEPVKGDWKDDLAYKIVSFAIKRGAKSFGVPHSEMRTGLKDIVLRRALVNVLEGIAYYGIQRPQTTISPFLVVWNFTHACNLRCKHCYQDAEGFAEDELTTEDAKRVVDEFHESGVVAIAFSGGEPLIRPDFFEIAEYAVRKGFYLSVATNGTLLTDKMVKKIKDSGIEYVEISLDGFEKEHDEFRGLKGAWKKTCEGIRNCVEAGLDTCVATTVTKRNFRDIRKLLDFVENNLKANRLIAFNFIPTRRGKDIMSEDLEPEEREELQKFLYSKLTDSSCKLNVLSTAPQYARIALEFAGGATVTTHFTNKAAMGMKGRTKKLGEFIGGCGAGRLYCGLEPNGDIQPCVFIPIKIGNIRKDRLKYVWGTSPVLKRMRERESFVGCGKCEYRYVCGGCRARAYGYFGDVQAPDPGCINNRKYWEMLKRGEELKISVERKRFFLF
ncbi:MAG: radical SAM protein [Candidatus Aenigmarchaeota archaeon]|nr:radical SAM protein [Candidatus Aenigmarchaeota archaeon]NIQ17546.1 radical SAM protein [Candidatus Aenigmarchaeota archaeon]NIS73124.1 radical SAM protein [Candidatus Aenigmarchaeota archaeon]